MQSLKQPYRILLSFDLEEFDIPNEYGASVPLKEQLSVTRQGLGRLLPVLDQLNIPATFFTTAYYALQNRETIKQMAQKHEIASHTYYHSKFSDTDIYHSRQVLSGISGQSVDGFRMPRLAPVEKRLIKEAGYTYDASLNPIWLPGRYNYFREPRTIFRREGIWIVPSSVTPHARIPLFWLAFKNLPLSFLKFCTLQTLKKDGYLSLYYHPWEYSDISAYKAMPAYTRKTDGTQLLDKLTAYLQWLQTLGGFCTMRDFVKSHQPIVNPRLVLAAHQN